MSRVCRVMKCAGWAGLALFLVKGMVWLAIFGAAAVGVIGK